MKKRFSALRTQRSSLTLLVFIGAALLIALFPLPSLASPVERTIRVEAENFAFTPAVLRVNPGDRVTIELVAKDVVHGLSIDGYPVNLTAEPGQTARVTFTANRAGSSKLRCSVACGGLHPFMTGKFEVGPNLLLYRVAALSMLIFLYGMWKALAPKMGPASVLPAQTPPAQMLRADAHPGRQR